MKNNFILIIIIVSILVFMFVCNEYKNFNTKETFNHNDNDKDNMNPYYYILPNIFYTKQFYDNIFIPPKPKTDSLAKINLDSYLDSDIVSNKIICANITNQAKCWDNNHCMWIKKINNGSYCTLAPKLL